MKITFDNWNQNPAADKVTTSQEAPFVQGRQQTAGAYALDISGIVRDNNVIYNNTYEDQGRSKKDVMQSFDVQMDINVQRDYMTVMSNILSTEDFNKMMEDGFDPSKIEPDQYVTIVDHIKAEMARSGQVTAGYNDDMTCEQLKEVLGDSSLAREVERALRDANLPVNKENAEGIKESLDKAASISSFDEAAKKYMVENHMEPTVENIYRSCFSASGDGSKQSHGYYAQEMRGYFAKKADEVDWAVMEPQLKKAIDKMDLSEQIQGKSMEQDIKLPQARWLQQAKWLVEKGIAVTQESMNTLGMLESISLPLDEKSVIQAGVHAILSGKEPFDGSLYQFSESVYDKAVRYKEEAEAITDDALKETFRQGKEITLHNLFAAQKQIQAAAETAAGSFTDRNIVYTQVSAAVDISFSQEKYVTASRQLAEVQLRMTIDANIKLLKSDYAIDTAPLSELVEMLKLQEEKMARTFLGGENTSEISQKADIFSKTQNILQDLPFMPAAVIGKITYEKSVTLSVVHTQGMALRAQYEAADASYETLMTSPRADMGDSIKKAFRNVDDILQDMGMEITEDNKKAVRILGYNSMQITEKSVLDVKEAWLQVEDVIKSMTPQKTLSMIRDGINPLTMDISELEQYLDQADHAPEEEMTKYSRFLYELEKNGQIKESEREAYIGVYRLFHQIEKSDGAVIGSLMAQGADLTLGNLLTAVRNHKAGKMDYRVDNDFGTLQDTVTKGKSISDQIENGIFKSQTAHAVYRDLSVEALRQISLHDEMTLDQLKDSLNQSDNAVLSEEISLEAAKDLLHEYRKEQTQAAAADDVVLQVMKQQGISFTVENILAVNNVLTQKGDLAKTVKETAQKLDQQTGTAGKETELKEAQKEIIEEFNDYDSAQEVLERWENTMKNTLQEAVWEGDHSYDEVRKLYQNYKQLSVMSTMRRNESYEVPVEINGEMTSIHLTMVHSTEEKGTVSISMEHASFGKAGARFKVSGSRIDGYFAADSEMGKERLQTVGEKILASFGKMGMEIGDVHYVNTSAGGRKEGNLLTFSKQDADNNNETVAAKQLYQVAKTFLKEMREFT